MKLTNNFNLKEFKSKDGASTPLELIPNIKELAENLQVLRDELNESITINSGYRSKSHNKKVKGGKNSQHLLGKAADIIVNNKTPKEVFNKIEELISNGKIKQGGLSEYNTFVHYDIRGNKVRW